MNFEDENTEFKREFTENIRKEVIAFANTSGGIIYVGLDGQGNLFPIENIDKTMQKITNTVRDSRILSPLENCTLIFPANSPESNIFLIPELSLSVAISSSKLLFWKLI
ncbi:hypothetical protein FACS189465_3690 [Clostridia bacterium]|nr:hypothetical protein FACS189465_3690 [Clostridia bacterium]